MKIVLICLVAIAVVGILVVRLLRGRLKTEKAGVDTRAPASATTVSDVGAFTIRLDIDEKAALFILLADDGSINRMGTGAKDNTDHELFIGKTDPALFQTVRSHLSKAIMASLGQGYEMRSPKGARCKLTLTFKFKGGGSNGVAFLYGSESEGPPNEVRDFVSTAVSQTEPWYEDFRRKALRRNEG